MRSAAPHLAGVALLVFAVPSCGTLFYDDDSVPSATATFGAPVTGTVLEVVVQVGEQCPHIPATPDPSCDPKPLADTRFTVLAPGGHTIATGRSGRDGKAELPLPGGGTYVVRGEKIDDYAVTPEQRVTVAEGARARVVLSYGNGIQ